MRSFIVLLFAVILTTQAQADDRQDFRGLFGKIEGKTLSCGVLRAGRGYEYDQYKLKIEENVPNSQSFAFMLNTEDGTRVLATLIAYYGSNRSPIGFMNVTTNGTATTYSHLYRVYLHNNTTELVLDSGKMAFSYSRRETTHHGEVLMMKIVCDPVDL